MATKYTGLSNIYTGLIGETSQIDPVLRDVAERKAGLTETDLEAVWAVEYAGRLYAGVDFRYCYILYFCDGREAVRLYVS